MKNKVFQKATKLGIKKAAAVTAADKAKASAAVAANKFAAKKANVAAAKNNALGLKAAVCIVEILL